MLEPIRKAVKSSRALAVVLVAALAFSAPRASQALLTELVVGAELAISAVGLMGQAMPQIALVATNVLALATTGQALVSTVKNIARMIFGQGEGGGADEGGDDGKITLEDLLKPKPDTQSRKATPVVSAPVEFPEIAMDSESKSSELSASGGSEAEIRAAVDRVVETYQRKMDVYGDLAVEREGSARHSSLGSSYARLVDENGEAVHDAITLLVDSVRDGEEARVDSFVTVASSLEKMDKPAILPVLERVLDQGRKFSAMNGDAGPAPLFERLQSLRDELEQ